MLKQKGPGRPAHTGAQRKLKLALLEGYEANKRAGRKAIREGLQESRKALKSAIKSGDGKALRVARSSLTIYKSLYKTLNRGYVEAKSAGKALAKAKPQTNTALVEAAQEAIKLQEPVPATVKSEPVVQEPETAKVEEMLHKAQVENAGAVA